MVSAITLPIQNFKRYVISYLSRYGGLQVILSKPVRVDRKPVENPIVSSIVCVMKTNDHTVASKLLESITTDGGILDSVLKLQPALTFGKM